MQESTYSPKKISVLSGVSRRTLRYYDDIGLLKPKRSVKNNYRVYTQRDLLLLQQILFYKELEFSIEDIKQILYSKNLNLLKTFKEHKSLLNAKSHRIANLISTIDKTVGLITQKTQVTDRELFNGFGEGDIDTLRTEVKKRYGILDR